MTEKEKVVTSSEILKHPSEFWKTFSSFLNVILRGLIQQVGWGPCIGMSKLQVKPKLQFLVSHLETLGLVTEDLPPTSAASQARGLG